MNVTKNLAFQILSEFGLVGMVLFQNIVVEICNYSRLRNYESGIRTFI